MKLSSNLKLITTMCISCISLTACGEKVYTPEDFEKDIGLYVKYDDICNQNPDAPNCANFFKAEVQNKKIIEYREKHSQENKG